MHHPWIERIGSNIHLCRLDILTQIDVLITVETTICIEPCNVLTDGTIFLVVALQQRYCILITLAHWIAIDLRRNRAAIFQIHRNLCARGARWQIHKEELTIILLFHKHPLLLLTYHRTHLNASQSILRNGIQFLTVHIILIERSNRTI